MRRIVAVACAVMLSRLGVLLGSISIMVIAMAPAAAQQGDLDATFKRYNELYAAGNYAAALVEAQKFEVGVKGRFGVNHANYALALSSLARVYEAQGKYTDAEPLSKRSLAIREKALGSEHPDVATALNNLALLYQGQARYADAEPLYKRTLSIWEKALGPNHPKVATSLNNLALLYRRQGRYADAEPLFKRSLAIREKALGSEHPDVATALNNLALLYRGQARYADAEPLYKRALAIWEKVLGPNHPNVATSLNNLALLYRGQGRYADAEPLYKRSLAIREKALGKDHPSVATALNNLAALSASSGNSENALAYSRKATAAVIAHAAAEITGTQRNEGAGGLVEQRTGYFVRHLANLAIAARKRLEPEATLGREALAIAQWTNQSSAAAAVQQLGLRFAANNDALAVLVRERQDFTALWRVRDKALIEALSKPEGQRNATLIESIRKQVADTEGRLAAVAARLAAEFPDYSALASPKPLKAEEVQNLLGPDEALVFLLAGDKESYVFALTREAFEWKTMPLGTPALSEKVSAFRHGLDVDALRRGLERGEC